MNNFQRRINYQGNLKPFLQQICKDFNIGEYKNHEIIPIGYEDFNLAVITNKGKYFVKIFGSFRSKDECGRYVWIMESILKAGVSHPLLFKSNQGYLYELSNNNLTDRLCIMQYINGKIFYGLQATPTTEEKRFIIKQAALINKINIKPPMLYDHWAITSFLEEYKEKSNYLSREDKKLIEPIVEIYNSLSIDDLPHCFVHGDITKTNTMKSANGDIYILDFAVANYYPRIQELAVILCDLFFDAKNPNEFPLNYDLALSEYQNYISLTADELEKLPNYVKLAHSMHILLANYEKVANKNSSSENEYFLGTGRVGLQYINQIWK
ncbi:MAG: phosphotransferase [bacterium]|nr:phosphotransferase [bacterium]